MEEDRVSHNVWDLIPKGIEYHFLNKKWDLTLKSVNLEFI